jgi:hypothetical protein
MIKNDLLNRVSEKCGLDGEAQFLILIDNFAYLNNTTDGLLDIMLDLKEREKLNDLLTFIFSDNILLIFISFLRSIYIILTINETSASSTNRTDQTGPVVPLELSHFIKQAKPFLYI